MGVEKMLRVYFLSQWYRLPDEALEDTINDSQAMRNFVGIDLSRESVPDATTLLKFRHLLENANLMKVIFEEVGAHLQERKLSMREETIVDAAIIAAPILDEESGGQTRSQDASDAQRQRAVFWHEGPCGGRRGKRVGAEGRGHGGQCV
jgi:IS5 family transposase